ncbi:hypothetical protein C2845_PM06G29740 [Panicum miliaceum]|uniref:Fe2OG dioxygenase domain-containing protein n=1 Tax=Panicum miliaceum TaxID=4540 RepID=A0A3L6RB94_PANMI|nr:hypothetical protein C2845_PM06G29740 [Panicum miliaceum]
MGHDYGRRLEMVIVKVKGVSPNITREILTTNWEVVEDFMIKTRGLAKELLRLLCEGMGLRPDYFEGDICGDHVTVDINHYLPCPDASTTLGLPPHCDRDVITILLPGPVPGLEVAYKGDWIKVEPLPHAFIVNFGQQLEVVTNGMLRSIEHCCNDQLSIVTDIGDCLIGPTEEFLSEDNPPCYRTLTFHDFKRMYNVVKLGESLNLTTNLKNIQKEM